MSHAMLWTCVQPLQSKPRPNPPKTETTPTPSEEATSTLTCFVSLRGSQLPHTNATAVARRPTSNESIQEPGWVAGRLTGQLVARDQWRDDGATHSESLERGRESTVMEGLDKPVWYDADGWWTVSPEEGSSQLIGSTPLRPGIRSLQ